MTTENTAEQARQSAATKFLWGVGAAILACVLVAGWQVVTRMGVTTNLAPIDLSLFRYAIPGLILAPIWLRCGLLPKGVNRGLILAMSVGAGLPFGLTVMAGAQYAPVAHMGALLPGLIPLFVAGMSAVLLKESFSVLRLVGFATVLIGALCVGWTSLQTLGENTIIGDLMFLGAAVIWAVYTIAFRKTGLTPWQGTAIVHGWSLFFVVPVWFFFTQGQIETAPMPDLILQIVWQGLAAGVVGIWVFSYSISAIGPSRAAAFGALVPVMVTLGGWTILNEQPPAVTLAGVFIVCLGVVLTTGVFEKKAAA